MNVDTTSDINTKDIKTKLHKAITKYITGRWSEYSYKILEELYIKPSRYYYYPRVTILLLIMIPREGQYLFVIEDIILSLDGDNSHYGRPISPLELSSIAKESLLLSLEECIYMPIEVRVDSHLSKVCEFLNNETNFILCNALDNISEYYYHYSLSPNPLVQLYNT